MALAPEALDRSKPYRVYLIVLAMLPMLGLAYSFEAVQKLYAMVGATFIPVLALALLLLMSGHRTGLGAQRNGPIAITALLAALLFFAGLAVAGIAAG